MRRYALLGLLFTVAVAVFVFPLITPPKPEAGPTPVAPSRAMTPNASPRAVLTAAQEQQYKRLSMEKDMKTSEHLCRLDCKRDLTHLLGNVDAAGNATRAAQLRILKQAVKSHRQFEALAWARSGSTVSVGTLPSQQAYHSGSEDLAAWNTGLTAIRKGESYESPTFTKNGKTYFVLAVPGKAKGEGMAALIENDIVQEVARHQMRNLRLVPYPDNSRYRTESVHANSLKDTTVRTGEDNGHTSHYAVDEVVVKFRSPLTTAQLMKLRKELQLTVVRRQRLNTYLFRSKTYNTKQLITYFRSKWHPVYAEPHYLYMTNEMGKVTALKQAAPTIVPNDTLYSEYQWNLPEIATEKGWNVTKGNQDVIVAVVDTGVQLDHPDLKGRLVAGTNIVDPSAKPDDDVGHGTHVAGIIAAEVNNKEGVAGMTWLTKVMPVKALDSTGAGTTYSVAEGIIWATDHGADVINLSLGNYAEAQFLHDAIKYAHDKGIVVIAASGNDNTDRPGYPAAYPEVVAVSATDQEENRAEYSNYGDYIDVAAPGSSIASTYPGSRYAALSGTSMASPHVAALASLIKAANPQLSNDQIADVMNKTARDLGAAGKDNDYGYGQIDVQAAVAAAGGGNGAAAADPAAAQGAVPNANAAQGEASTAEANNTQVLQDGLLDRLQKLLSSFFSR